MLQQFELWVVLSLDLHYCMYHDQEASKLIGYNGFGSSPNLTLINTLPSPFSMPFLW